MDPGASLLSLTIERQMCASSNHRKRMKTETSG